MSADNRKLIIIGAGGQGRVVADVARLVGYTDILFADDGKSGAFAGFPIFGTLSEVTVAYPEADYVIAVGDNKTRKKIAETNNLCWTTLIHPTAVISQTARIECGTVIMAGAVVNAGAKVCKHCIVNTGAIVEHDNILSDFVHISPRAALGGTVTVGEGSHIGIGAVVRNNINICENAVIGAGAAVVKHIAEPGTYVGVPAKKMR